MPLWKFSIYGVCRITHKPEYHLSSILCSLYIKWEGPPDSRGITLRESLNGTLRIEFAWFQRADAFKAKGVMGKKYSSGQSHWQASDPRDDLLLPSNWHVVFGCFASPPSYLLSSFPYPLSFPFAEKLRHFRLLLHYILSEPHFRDPLLQWYIVDGKVWILCLLALLSFHNYKEQYLLCIYSWTSYRYFKSRVPKMNTPALAKTTGPHNSNLPLICAHTDTHTKTQHLHKKNLQIISDLQIISNYSFSEILWGCKIGSPWLPTWFYCISFLFFTLALVGAFVISKMPLKNIFSAYWSVAGVKISVRHHLEMTGILFTWEKWVHEYRKH